MIQFLLAFSGLSLVAFAQSVDVSNVSADQEGTTTIEIKKTKGSQTTVPQQGNSPLWEIVEGEDDLEGDVADLGSEAKTNWKKACNDWKKEFRADNKENKIISMSCGTPSCVGSAGQKTCTSKAKYKIKTKVN